MVIAAVSSQVCAGMEGGCDAAVHAVYDVFSHEDTEEILIVDAANAFNSLNRKATLHNMKFICPALATILTNTYQSQTRMFVSGGGEVLLSEAEAIFNELPPPQQRLLACMVHDTENLHFSAE